MMVRCATCCGPIQKASGHLFPAGYSPNFWIEIEGWGLSPRGAGYLFGKDVVTAVRTCLLSIECCRYLSAFIV